ncbi:hypothetical protein ACFPVV_01535 [Macrococcoides bohemicum]|uniref:Lipoprotein n=1 Tax=Macrococcoides bohemicum TaxID=1903056 RepID=A0A328A6R7_9STAP|nr:hypothetical protein [Macrococcus bohemicus]RAK50169.1 hypothetical protein BHX94_01515 [Macrococcus bohemicus]
MTFKALAGLTFTSALLLGACGGETTEKKENKTEEKAATKTKEKSSDETTTKQSNIASENHVYGSMSDNLKEKGLFFIDEKNNISYMGDKDNIFQVEKEIDKNLGITIDLDKNFLTEHAFDYMEDDASMVQQKSENEFVYESKKIGKKYDVIFSRPDGKIVERIIVSQHQ